jgi:hypothetical protein
MDILEPLHRITDVRAMTLNPLALDTEEINSSVRPSAKYSSIWSGPMLVSGRMAILSFGNVDLVGMILLTDLPNPAIR